MQRLKRKHGDMGNNVETCLIRYNHKLMQSIMGLCEISQTDLRRYGPAPRQGRMCRL